ncbi:hypothetical protein Dsin_002118 [Dipteronia sinensis]|uniref:Uncharacterized protein n=1 Tax=Dipteronia sinensis TaxID=43782 RepID=A0AAE0B5J4_9ROSI|nr:hypothetical protein Dsin_002118 [Dipteronia sinensis]
MWTSSGFVADGVTWGGLLAGGALGATSGHWVLLQGTGCYFRVRSRNICKRLVYRLDGAVWLSGVCCVGSNDWYAQWYQSLGFDLGVLGSIPSSSGVRIARMLTVEPTVWWGGVEIMHLVQQRRPPIKEYVQSTALDNCLIPATYVEQYVDLEIGQPLIDQWIGEDSYMATLHHLIAYRLQDHALDLLIPGHSDDTIFIKAEKEDEVPTIIQIPKQLPRDQLVELMPLSWITNYEKAFQSTVPVIASNTTYTRQPDSTIKTVYKPLTDVPASHPEVTPSAPPDPPIFQSLMTRPVTSEDDIPIHNLEADGSAIYIDKINGHFIWDADPSMCDPDCSCRRSSKRHQRSSCNPDRQAHSPDDPDSPWVGLLPISRQHLLIYDRALQILRAEVLLPQPPSQPIPCFMASSYDQDFPPYRTHF